ncbi:putative Profilin superfamily [Helianthus annuus]|nr:putative Profilin superfamily [Helianthus annuus]KAJ0545768.1 putative Profilin superfamily [Helianthus annuus]KAJ0603995.1 putative Profilin superfamily [Helianthus annuus]KAJ0618002.1 putative Profilin superfamily [Helianthus annuus]KAJ0686543.1 putative Profilin superfamily [Helianthus annuus]
MSLAHLLQLAYRLHLGGTKYMVIQGEAGAVIRGKKDHEERFETISQARISSVDRDCLSG